MRPPTVRRSLAAKGTVSPAPSRTVPVAAIARTRAIVVRPVLDEDVDVPTVLVVATMGPGAAETAAPARARLLPVAARRRPPATTPDVRGLGKTRRLPRRRLGLGPPTVVVLAGGATGVVPSVATPRNGRLPRPAKATRRPYGVEQDDAGSPVAFGPGATRAVAGLGGQAVGRPVVGRRSPARAPREGLRPEETTDVAQATGVAVTGVGLATTVPAAPSPAHADRVGAGLLRAGGLVRHAKGPVTGGRDAVVVASAIAT